MKKPIISKLGFCILFGALVPLGTAHAWDGSDIQDVSYDEGNAATAPVTAQALHPSQGSQGPMRNNLAQHKPAAHKNAAKAHKSEHTSFPYTPTEDKNYPYTDGGSSMSVN
jgi:hypothetical protein